MWGFDAMDTYENQFFKCAVGEELYTSDVIGLGQKASLWLGPTYSVYPLPPSWSIWDLPWWSILLIVLASIGGCLCCVVIICTSSFCACCACQKERITKRRLRGVENKLKTIAAQDMHRDDELRLLRAQRAALEESVKISEAKVTQLGQSSAEGQRAQSDLAAHKIAADDLDAQLKLIEATAAKELARASVLQEQETAHRAELLKRRMERAKRQRAGKSESVRAEGSLTSTDERQE